MVSCEASVATVFMGRTPAEQLQQPVMAPHERFWPSAWGGVGVVVLGWVGGGSQLS